MSADATRRLEWFVHVPAFIWIQFAVRRYNAEKIESHLSSLVRKNLPIQKTQKELNIAAKVIKNFTVIPQFIKGRHYQMFDTAGMATLHNKVYPSDKISVQKIKGNWWSIWQRIGINLESLPKCQLDRFDHSLASDGVGASIHIFVENTTGQELQEDNEDEEQVETTAFVEDDNDIDYEPYDDYPVFELSNKIMANVEKSRGNFCPLSKI